MGAEDQTTEAWLHWRGRHAAPTELHPLPWVTCLLELGIPAAFVLCLGVEVWASFCVSTFSAVLTAA